MAITRTPLIDDDGSGTTGTILNNAWQTGLYNAIDAALGLPARIGYTPVWGSTGGGPTLGNGIIDGWYRVFGTRCEGQFRLILGSTSSAPAGVFTFSLPVPPSATATNMLLCGVAMLTDASAGDFSGTARFLSATQMMVNHGDTVSTGVGNTTPFVWTPSDALRVSFWYEI